MCFELGSPSASALDAPIVWFEHEIIVPMGADAFGDRSRIEEHAQALYDNFHELVHDVFGDAEPA